MASSISSVIIHCLIFSTECGQMSMMIPAGRSSASFMHLGPYHLRFSSCRNGLGVLPVLPSRQTDPLASAGWSNYLRSSCQGRSYRFVLLLLIIRTDCILSWPEPRVITTYDNQHSSRWDRCICNIRFTAAASDKAAPVQDIWEGRRPNHVIYRREGISIYFFGCNHILTYHNPIFVDEPWPTWYVLQHWEWFYLPHYVSQRRFCVRTLRFKPQWYLDVSDPSTVSSLLPVPSSSSTLKMAKHLSRLEILFGTLYDSPHLTSASGTDVFT